MTREMHFRHAVNKAKNILFEPEQVTYKEDDSEPRELVEGALDAHIEASQNTPEYQAIAPRPEHFKTGQEDAVPDNVHRLIFPKDDVPDNLDSYTIHPEEI